MSTPDTVPEKRPAQSPTPLALIVALGALGLLLVLLLFQADPTTDPPPDQNRLAMALVSELMTNGVLVDYDCHRGTAWVNRPVWGKYTFEQRRNMVIGLATVCQAQRMGYRISVLDYDTKAEIGSFDGATLELE